MPRVYLSLGANQSPRENLASALAALRDRFGTLAVSTVYRTPAVGFDGADFLNLAVGLDTDLAVPALAAWLRALEDRHGRRRDVPRFSDRPLDVDIVLYGDETARGPGTVEIPRGELFREAFVLAPMAEIAPDVVPPGTSVPLAALWRAFPRAGCVLIAEPPLS